MVTVMVISCPHALGLAVPLVVAISTSISAQKGLLIRNRTAFENARLDYNHHFRQDRNTYKRFA
jgi:Cu2+-exporting ATPase